jgi:tetratricopeptide (TPR) repeat protein
MFRAHALAMLGRFDEARDLLAQARAELIDRGGGIELGSMLGLHWVEVERLAGDPVAAADVGMEGCRLLDELGEHGMQSTAAGYVAQALYALDRLDEADGWALRAAELGASDDMFTQMLWRQAMAKVVARRGQSAKAERFAREAVALAKQTDAIDGQGWARADLAEVLAIAGRLEEAGGELEAAIALFVRKGNVVMAERTRDRLTALREDAPA